jgi:plastocyanin
MRRNIFGTVLVIGLLLAACNGESGGDGADTTGQAAPDATITIADFAFDSPASVAVGDTVEVTNEDSVGHTWTATGGEFDSGTLDQGDTFEFTFDEAGEFDFFCSVHPDMTGTITVEG